MGTKTISLKDEAYKSVVTKDVDHFRRVPGLEVESY